MSKRTVLIASLVALVGAGSFFIVSRARAAGDLAWPGSNCLLTPSG